VYVRRHDRKPGRRCGLCGLVEFPRLLVRVRLDGADGWLSREEFLRGVR
jgi:hypothetical protein